MPVIVIRHGNEHPGYFPPDDGHTGTNTPPLRITVEARNGISRVQTNTALPMALWLKANASRTRFRNRVQQKLKAVRLCS